MNLYPVLVFIWAMLILDRLSMIAHAGHIDVSKDAFLEAVLRMDAPVVLITERAYFWVLGAARHHYTCTYKDYRLHARSFASLDLPASVDVIHIRKW